MGEEIPVTEKKNPIITYYHVVQSSWITFGLQKKIKPNTGILIEYIRHFAKQ